MNTSIKLLSLVGGMFFFCGVLPAQWKSTQGPQSSMNTYHILALDTVLVVSTNCEPLYSTDRGSTWE